MSNSDDFPQHRSGVGGIFGMSEISTEYIEPAWMGSIEPSSRNSSVSTTHFLFCLPGSFQAVV